MATRRYRLSRQARSDLDNIADYLGERSPMATRRVLSELLRTFQILANNPELGSRRDDLRSNIRSFSPSRPARSYVVLYYIRSDGVEISDVIHAARDWPGMFSRGQR